MDVCKGTKVTSEAEILSERSKPSAVSIEILTAVEICSFYTESYVHSGYDTSQMVERGRVDMANSWRENSRKITSSAD